METSIYEPSSEGEISLLVLESNEVCSYILSSNKRWTLGRQTSENKPDIPLKSRIASRSHGEFFNIDSQWFYCDKGSLNGSFHNGKKIATGINGRVNPILLNNGDVLRIDYEDLETPDSRGIWIAVVNGSVSGNWTYFAFGGKDIIIGRDASKCDITLPLPYISSVHAKITFLNNEYYLSDCESHEGTWLNGKRVCSSIILKSRDRISICDCHFIFIDTGVIYNRKSNFVTPRRVRLDPILSASIKSKTVHHQGNNHQEKVLIRDVNLTLHAGHLVALLGSSGAGKTTLMNCLSGIERGGVDGHVQLYGEDLYQNYERLKRVIGYVPQDNIVHDILPIEDELIHAAALRLPGDTSKAELEEQVRKTLQILNLYEKRRLPINKLSGGEKKRVNIAIDLVADREIIFLDEPDAGLSPEFKVEVFLALHNLAHMNAKCVVAIIHDVSEINYFDEVIMMGKINDTGRLLYFGSPTDAVSYFGVSNFSEIYNIVSAHPERYLHENEYT